MSETNEKIGNESGAQKEAFSFAIWPRFDFNTFLFRP